MYREGSAQAPLMDGPLWSSELAQWNEEVMWYNQDAQESLSLNCLCLSSDWQQKVVAVFPVHNDCQQELRCCRHSGEVLTPLSPSLSMPPSHSLMRKLGHSGTQCCIVAEGGKVKALHVCVEHLSEQTTVSTLTRVDLLHSPPKKNLLPLPQTLDLIWKEEQGMMQP